MTLKKPEVISRAIRTACLAVFKRVTTWYTAFLQETYQMGIQVGEHNAYTRGFEHGVVEGEKRSYNRRQKALQVKRNQLPFLTKKQVILRDDFTCYYCKKKLWGEDETVDHKVPLAMGGTNDLKNLVACCRNCNHDKADNP